MFILWHVENERTANAIAKKLGIKKVSSFASLRNPFGLNVELGLVREIGSSTPRQRIPVHSSVFAMAHRWCSSRSLSPFFRKTMSLLLKSKLSRSISWYVINSFNMFMPFIRHCSRSIGICGELKEY